MISFIKPTTKTLKLAKVIDSSIPCTYNYMMPINCTFCRFRLCTLAYHGQLWTRLLSLCPICQRMVPQSHREPLKPIIAKGFMQRGQVCDKLGKKHNYKAKSSNIADCYFTLETKALTENLVTSCLSLLRQGVSSLDNPQSVIFSLLWVFSQNPWLCLLPAAADRCTSGQS